MVRILIALLTTSLSSLKSRQELAVENLVLRQQLAVYNRKVKRPKLNKADRAFWLVLMQWWPKWREALVIVKPETVIAWHRKGFRLFWAWKSRRLRRVRDLIEGRPKVDAEIRTLIRQMAEQNRWGAPRIHGELLELGFEVSQATVSR